MGLLTPCSVLRGGFLYIMIVPGGRFLLPQAVSRGFVKGGGWFWMKLIPALQGMFYCVTKFSPCGSLVLVLDKYTLATIIHQTHCYYELYEHSWDWSILGLQWRNQTSYKQCILAHLSLYWGSIGTNIYHQLLATVQDHQLKLQTFLLKHYLSNL